MSKSIKKNYIYNLMYQVLAIVVPLITTPYLSRVLGAERIGIYSYTLSITTYFILFGSLGVAMYGQREIAFVQNDKEKRSKIFFEVFIMKATTMLISMVIFFLVFCMHGNYNVYYRILILEILANLIDISWFFQGIEEFKKTVIRNSLVKIISVVCIFLFIKSKEDLLWYFVIYVLSTFLGNASLWISLPKHVCKVKRSDLKPFRHLKPTLGLFVPQIAIQLYTVLDKTMIGTIVTDKTEVGYYEQAQKIVKLLLTIATSLGTVMVPRMASTFASGDKEKVNEYMKMSFKFVFFLSFPLMFGIISVTKAFVPIFFGNGYEKVVVLINIMSPILVLMGIANVVGTQYLLPTKRQKEYTISVTIGVIVNFFLNYFLIKKYESIGAAIATVLSQLVVDLIQLQYIKDEIDIKGLLVLARKYLLSGIVMFLLCFIVGKFAERLNTGYMIQIVSQVLVGVVVYFAMLIGLKDDYVYKFINVIKNKVLK